MALPRAAVIPGLLSLVLLFLVLLALVPNNNKLYKVPAQLQQLRLASGGNRSCCSGSGGCNSCARDDGNTLQETEPLFWGLLQANMAPFEEGGITREDIEHAVAAHPQPQFAERLLIHNNQLYAWAPDAPANETRREGISYLHKMVLYKLLCR